MTGVLVPVGVYCLVVSAVNSHFYFWYAFASIWCFFAAIISLYLGHLFRTWPTRGASASI